MIFRSFVLAMLLLALGVSASDAVAWGKKKPVEESRAIADVNTLPSCDGPKPRVAVFAFQATGKLGAFEGFNVGDGLAAQLATELERSGCFVIVDYTAMSNVLTVQEMGLAGIVNRETAPRTGQVVGAELIIKGSVTEYEAQKRGRGITLGVGISKLPFGTRLGRNSNTAHVAMDLSVIDASTGTTKFSHRVEADSKGGGWTVGFDFEKWNIGTDDFSKSPVGLATRNALAQAVTRLIDERKNLQLEWRMQVASADGGRIMLNAGQVAGVRVGDKYRVSTPVRTVTDPRTGLLLDRVERELGLVEITSVEDNLSFAKPLAQFDVKRGDFVHL